MCRVISVQYFCEYFEVSRTERSRDTSVVTSALDVVANNYITPACIVWHGTNGVYHSLNTTDYFQLLLYVKFELMALFAEWQIDLHFTMNFEMHK